MEEKKHCKWYNDEFCTNEDSPCIADYCPVWEYPELCKFREEDKCYSILGKNKKEIASDIRELRYSIEKEGKFYKIATFMEIVEKLLEAGL